MAAVGMDILGESSTPKEVEEDGEWIETTLPLPLNSHVITLRETARSKRWWTSEVVAKQKEYGRTTPLYQEGRTNAFTLRVEQNSYYYMVCRAKRQY